MRKIVYDDTGSPVSGTPLSPREEEVLHLIAQGESNKEIAFAQDVSEQTIKNRVTSILRKLGTNSRAGAIRVGIQKKLLMADEFADSTRQIDILADMIEIRLRKYIYDIARQISNEVLNTKMTESKVLDVKYGDELGYNNKRKYTLVTCLDCGIPRWVTDAAASLNRVCYACSGKRKLAKHSEMKKVPTVIPYKHIERKDFGEPKILDIKCGKDIGRDKESRAKYAYVVCPACNLPRWLPIHCARKNPICRNCNLYHGGLRGTHEEEITRRKEKKTSTGDANGQTSTPQKCGIESPSLSL